jgi:hypothetical protein
MMYRNMDCCVFGLCPSPCILYKTKEQKVSENGECDAVKPLNFIWIYLPLQVSERQTLLCRLCRRHCCVGCVADSAVSVVWQTVLCRLCRRHCCVGCVADTAVSVVWQIALCRLCGRHCSVGCVADTAVSVVLHP